MVRSIVTFVFFGFLIMGSAYAESTPTTPQIPDIPKPLNVMPSKIKPVQTNEDELSKAAPESSKSQALSDNSQLELLSPSPEKGFDNNFGQNLTREDINKVFSQESKTSLSIFRRELALKLALTPFPKISSDKKFPENIYGLRLNTLMNLGEFDEAEKLYKLNENAPPSPLAARSGVEALVATGKIAVACLDQKTFDNSLKSENPQFWANFSSFCQALLSPAAGNDDELRLINASRAYNEISKPSAPTPEELNKLDVITTISMLKIGRLNSLTSSLETLRKIDDKHLGLIYRYSIPGQTSFEILAEGLARGIISSDEALKTLKENDIKTSNINYGEFLLEYFKNPDAPVLTDKLLNIAINNPIKEKLLYPLYKEKAPDTPLPESNKIMSLRIMALTNQNLPENFILSAYNIDNPIKSDEKSGELVLINLLIEKAKLEAETPSETPDAVLLALSYANYPQKGVKYSYDNILSLTGFDNYVMHNTDILNGLKKFADKKQADQVVIRSLAIIDDSPLEKLHPAELYQILEALNSAGLTEETIHLTREVLGNRMKN